MIWNIVALEIIDDDFTTSSSSDSKTLFVDLSGSDKKTGIQTNIAKVLDDYGAYPSEVATDLLKLGMVVFTADKSADRKKSFNKWSRYFRIYQPVADVSLWNGIKDKVEKALNFLTGDHWEIYFRQEKHKHPISEKQLQEKFPELTHLPTTIALMSGGLDSFTGAVDLLEITEGGVIFVSHYGRGGVTKTVQDRIYSLLDKHYPKRFRALQFFVQPADGISDESEASQRSRSFLFLSLSAAVASTDSNRIPLHVYENGLISLNVPLAPNRGGGLSTRTTHPHFLSTYQDILNSLSIDASIITPFRFLTKGEMLSASKNPGVLQEGIKLTHSCSHTTYVRFKGKSMDNHCGYCLPCIVRRAATTHAGFDDVNFVVDVLKGNIRANNLEGKDLYAVKVALKRLEITSPSLISHVRASGPLPGTQEEISQYVDVYKRGMAELQKLLE
jgi:hypothetical protein